MFNKLTKHESSIIANTQLTFPYNEEPWRKANR